jgi:hypothetical protein
MSRGLSFFIWLGMVWAVSGVAQAQQDSRVLSLYDRQSYEYIKQLQDRGHLLELHPTDMPYRYDELHEALQGVMEAWMPPKSLCWTCVGGVICRRITLSAIICTALVTILRIYGP